jgi:hypothetical protein
MSNQALGSHGVTLQNPPKNDLFACFHKSQNVPTAPDPVNLASAYNFPAFPPPWAPMYDPRMFIPQAPPAYASSLPPSNSQHPSTGPSLKHSLSLSTDGGQDHEPYPFIMSFLTDIAAHNPHCPALDGLADKFQNEDLFTIDEIASLSEERLRDHFGLSLGNARFVLDQVRKEMNHIDKINGKKRSRH